MADLGVIVQILTSEVFLGSRGSAVRVFWCGYRFAVRRALGREAGVEIVSHRFIAKCEEGNLAT